MLQDEVVLEEPEEALDLPLRPGPAGVHEVDPEPPGVVLVVRLADRARGFELAPPIREERLGQPPAGEGRVHHGEEVDPELPGEEAPCEDEPAVVVQGEDQVEVPEQREAHLPPEVDLPEVVGRGRHEALGRLHRRLAESAQPMADPDQPDGLAGDGEPQEIPELPGGAVRPRPLGLDAGRFLGRREPTGRAPAPVPESLRPPVPVAAQMPAEGRQGHLEQDGRRPTAQDTGQDILYGLFLSVSRIVSTLPSFPKDPIHPTGKADSLNVEKALNSNLE